MAKKESCDLNKKVICPRCKAEFVADTELTEHHDHDKENDEELNVMASCPICGNKTRIEF